MGEVRSRKVHRSGKHTAAMAFSSLKRLPHHSARIAQEFSTLPTELLVAKGSARKQSTRKRVAVLFSGGPASGGHDVLCGIADVLKDHELLGVFGGPGGLLRGNLRPFSTKGLRGTGGFDALGTDRTRLEPHITQACEVIRGHKLDALIIIGGDDSNTNAAYLARAMPDLQVIGVPKTMDCDVRAEPWLPVTFGFDTACRTYAQMVGNLIVDARSSRKYWHFVRLMGRDASHVTLEVALQTRPALAIISEEELWHRRTLADEVEHIAHVIRQHRAAGTDWGVILIPEGLLEHLSDMRELVDELGAIWARKQRRIERLRLPRRRALFARLLHPRNRARFLTLPERFQELLSLNRDEHGNIRLSQIPTEELLMDLVRARIEEDLPGYTLKAERHFYGYEGRCGAPSGFDSDLSYRLGRIAGSLVVDGRTGYLAAIGGDLDAGGTAYAIPLATMLDEFERAGERVIAIKKRTVHHDDPAFAHFAAVRRTWTEHDASSPGPYRTDKRELPFTVALNIGARR